MVALPPEVMLRLLGLLAPEDLCRCLAVSPLWRQLADSDSLWRPLAQRRHLRQAHDTDSGVLPLCSWARTYISYMRRLVGNWRTGSFQSYRLEKEDWFCCIASSKDLVAVYYPRAAQVRLYGLEDGLVPVCSMPVSLPGGTAIPDVLVSDSHLVLTKGNAVLVYTASERGFQLRKAIVGTENGLVLTDGDPLPQPSDRRLYVKLVAEDIVWLESDTVYVVDMAANNYRVLDDTFRCLRFDGTRIFTANDVISVFSLAGEKLFQLDIRCVADMWLGEDLLVVLIGCDDQILEVWRVSSRSLLHSRAVTRDPTLCLGKDSIYLLELGEGVFSLSSLDLATGKLAWSYRNVFPRELVLHPDIRLLCERFLFLRPSHTRDENFLLVDSVSGSVLYDSVMPPSLSPPAYIYHLSDETFITAESNIIHIRRYM